MEDGTPIWIDYTNHKGERAWRNIKPLNLWFGQHLYHWEEGKQYILIAFDLQRNAERGFAVKDIHEWKTEKPL